MKLHQVIVMLIIAGFASTASANDVDCSKWTAAFNRAGGDVASEPSEFALSQITQIYRVSPTMAQCLYPDALFEVIDHDDDTALAHDPFKATDYIRLTWRGQSMSSAVIHPAEKEMISARPFDSGQVMVFAYRSGQTESTTAK